MRQSSLLITMSFLIVIGLVAYYLGYSAGIDSGISITGATTLNASSQAKLPWVGILALVVASLTVVYALFSEVAPMPHTPSQPTHYYQSLQESQPLQKPPEIRTTIYPPRPAINVPNPFQRKQPQSSRIANRRELFNTFEKSSKRQGTVQQQATQPSVPQKQKTSPEYAEVMERLKQMRDRGLF